MKTKEEGKYLVLQEDVYYHDVVIPRGTKWDGASIPALARSVLGCPKDLKYRKASLLHDWFYRHHEKSKLEADVIFAYELFQADVKPWKIYAMGIALFLFGWLGYYWPFTRRK